MRGLMWFLVFLTVALLVLGLYCTYFQPAPAAVPGAVVPTHSVYVAQQAPLLGITNDEQYPLGLPLSRTRQLQVLHKSHFTIGYDNERREPAWVWYALSGPVVFHGKEHRPQTFADDPEVVATAHHADYTRSGFDRGHLAPAYAMFSRFGQDGLTSTFVTSNIIPQVHALNAGRWEELEVMIAGRDGLGDGWAGRYGQVYVTDGPVHTTDLGTLPGGEPEPGACFMIVERRDGQTWTSLAFEVPNRHLTEPASSFLVSIHQVEQDTGLDFDTTLTSEQQAALESSAALQMW